MANRTVTKRELCERIAKKTGYSQVVTKEAWEAKRGDWLPSDADKAYVLSLMQKPVFDPRQMANWIAAPKQGIKGRAVDFEYVRREA